MEKKSIKKNYIYNLSYQMLLIITPLVTTPYLSRVLGADGIGSFSFAESIVSYFLLFAVLGITIYGQREISYVQDNKKKRTQVFWETKFLEMMTSIMVIMIYIPFAFLQQNRRIYFILLFNLFTVTIDISWLLQGMEEFGKTAIRNMLFRVLNIIFIFTAVKTKDHLNRYVFSVVFFHFLSNLSLWTYLPAFVGIPNWKEFKPFKKIKIVLSLFIPTIAMQIYTVLDKTMIGLITQNVFENGYYEQSIKISRMVLTIVTALGTVMIPRIGFYYEKGEMEIVNSLMYRGYRFVWFLGIPLCFGLIGVSSNFVPWFFGEGFDKVIPLLNILSFLILAIGINNVTGMQYLIPTKRQNLFTFTVLIGAGVNLILNLMLIPLSRSIGAAIASVAAEMVIAFVQLWFVRKEFLVKKVFISCWNYLISGGIMLGGLIIMGRKLEESATNTLIMIFCGAVIYSILLLILRDDFFIKNAKIIVCKILQKST